MIKEITLLILCLLFITCEVKDSTYKKKKEAAGVRMIKVNGEHEVWTQKIGSGEKKLLLLHGGPGATHEYFENFPLHLDTSEYTIYLYDQLGSYFSDSPPLENLWQINRFVEEVEDVRKGLGITNIHLLGHSWGGVLAIYYSIKYPESLESLILSNTPVTSHGAYEYRVKLREAIEKEIKSKLGRKPKRREVIKRYEQIHRYGLDTIPEVFIRLEKHYNRDENRRDNGLLNKKEWNLSKQLGLINTRTLIIGGESDFIDPNDFKVTHDNIVNSKLILLKNAPHFPMWSNTTDYFKAINEFIID